MIWPRRQGWCAACVGLLIACGAKQPPAPSEVRAVPMVQAPKKVEASRACADDAECTTGPSACGEPRCIAGRCSFVPAPAPTRCELTPEQQGYQSWYDSEQGQAGVCRLGACIPRMQCAELCGVQRAPELWERQRDHYAECISHQPEEKDHCLHEVLRQPELLLAARQVFDDCILGCGFPRIPPEQSSH